MLNNCLCGYINWSHDFISWYKGRIKTLYILQLYDWITVNKLGVKGLLKDADTDGKGSLSTDMFMSTLSTISIPLEEESRAKLLAIYDKKGEGEISYSDLLSEHKYIHAVSTV